MFKKNKKKDDSSESKKDLLDESSVLDMEFEDEVDTSSDTDVIELDENGNPKKESLKDRFNRISRSYKKHLIFVRITMLVSALGLLGISSVAGIALGLHTEGAKAREVTQPGTTLQFSKTGGALMVGKARRYGTTIMVPLYNDGVSGIDTSAKPTIASGSFGSATSGIKLPSYGNSGDSSNSGFIPISAKNYRMYVSTLKGRVSRSMQVRYVKFGATGLGAIIVSHVGQDQTVRILIENKKVYKTPGADAPGLTVSGQVVQTNRDVLLLNTNLQSAKLSKQKFSITSDSDVLFKTLYTQDYMTVWNRDKSTLDKLQKVDEQKLKELKENKTSINAGDSASSDVASSDSSNSSSVRVDGGNNSNSNSTSSDVIQSQQTIVDADNESQNELDAAKSALNDYAKRVSSQMTVSSEFNLK